MLIERLLVIGIIKYILFLGVSCDNEVLINYILVIFFKKLKLN